MRIEAVTLGVAVGIGSAVWTICSVLVATAPEPSAPSAGGVGEP